MPRVLIVEDEKEIREMMALLLTRNNMDVTECVSAEGVYPLLSKSNYHLAIVDWMLPGISGIDLVKKINRSHPKLPMMMVTAKTNPQEIIEGLEAGADDYLTKPFEPSVFLARVKALLRRGEGAQEASSTVVQLHGLEIDFLKPQVILNEVELHLTRSEFKILEIMIQQRGRVLTRDQMISYVQGTGVNVTGRTIDTHIFGLRKKLGSWGENVETIRGIGYRVKMEN